MGKLVSMNFRTWCMEKWFEHRDESIAWNGFETSATQQEYFNKYKYWLKREYQHQKRTEK